MNESRRNVLWSALIAGLSSLLTLKWLQAAPTEDHTRVSPELAVKLSEAPNYDKDEVLMVAMGATIPNQRNTCYYRGKVGHRTADVFDRQYKAAWFAAVEPGEIPDDVYPRLSGFMVNTEMLLGTIDEIVEDFKQKLITARQAVREGHTPILAEHFGCTPEHQAALRALRDQYQGSNPAASLPEDHAGMVRKVLARQAELNEHKPKLDFNSELRQLKTSLERLRDQL